LNLRRLEQYGLGGHSWASLMYMRVFDDKLEHMDAKDRKGTSLDIPIGSVFVFDPAFEEHALWKLPGGEKDDKDETPLDTAVRENAEETGIVIKPERVHFADKQWKQYAPDIKRSYHWKCMFYADIYMHEVEEMLNTGVLGNGGEISRFFHIDDMRSVFAERRFMQDHLDRLVASGLILYP
jgi:8-oxo-dGTP pyrophosphatase MutT (NUDIX family)